MKPVTQPDPWQALAALTAARIALGRSGSSLPTRAVLNFDIAHALARDAVHQRLDVAELANRWLDQSGGTAVLACSRAGDRLTYLQRLISVVGWTKPAPTVYVSQQVGPAAAIWPSSSPTACQRPPSTPMPCRSCRRYCPGSTGCAWCRSSWRNRAG